MRCQQLGVLLCHGWSMGCSMTDAPLKRVVSAQQSACRSLLLLALSNQPARPLCVCLFACRLNSELGAPMAVHKSFLDIQADGALPAIGGHRG